MRTITNEELKEILEKHVKWFRDESDGERANLSEADLYRADLSGANLSGANLSGANLFEANLSEADLHGANLFEANLSRSYLYRANLYGANLFEADLSEADLSEADLSESDLYRANLYGAINVPYIPMSCPEKGAFIGFKKAYNQYGLENELIVELMILEDSKRSSATGRKCRCDKAKVISITSLSGDTIFNTAVSNYDNNFIYKVGEIVSVSNFDENRFKECAPGIHFFINRQEAVDYIF